MAMILSAEALFERAKRERKNHPGKDFQRPPASFFLPAPARYFGSIMPIKVLAFLIAYASASLLK
jgi:hypothetical protein